MARLSWRAQLEVLAEQDDLTSEDVDTALARMAIGVASEVTNAHQAEQLLRAVADYKVKSREAAPSDMVGFAVTVAQQLEMMNGGAMPRLIEHPKPKPLDTDGDGGS